MLAELRIENLGLIEHLSVVFDDGLVVLTGETGAGKTMLIEAVNLLIGERADPGRVRSGSVEAKVEGRFVVEDEEFVVVRVVSTQGRSRAYINGQLATVGELAHLGSRLVDLHGQHAHQSLLSAPVQRAALDQFAGTDLGPLRAARVRIHEIDESLASFGGDSRSRVREIELLRFQVDEIDAARIVDPDEDLSLDTEESRLADTVAHREACYAAVSALSDEGASADGVRTALSVLAHRAALADLRDRVSALQSELDDVVGELRRRGDDSEEDPERLAEVRARRQLLRELRRKYGESLAEVLNFAEECRSRLAELESFEERVEALESQRLQALEEERTAAARVAETRKRAAEALGRAITAHLPSLAMPRAVVEISVEGEDPADEVRMMLSSNPGSPLAPLSKVASGGELARTMLAIRLVLTQGPPILVFDEVDAGIGGSAANALAESLEQLGATHQVLVVTHLAQVAAKARQHLVVSKAISEFDGRESTSTTVVEVVAESRIDEIARMLSGHPDSARARDHAAELLGAQPT